LKSPRLGCYDKNVIIGLMLIE